METKVLPTENRKPIKGNEEQTPLPNQANPRSLTPEQGLPMSRADYLLSHLAQECCEVAIRCTKAQHFGLGEVEPGQPLTNQERILYEFADVLAIADVMREVGILPDMNALSPEIESRIREKKVKAAKFRNYSRDLGRV